MSLYFWQVDCSGLSLLLVYIFMDCSCASLYLLGEGVGGGWRWDVVRYTGCFKIGNYANSYGDVGWLKHEHISSD